MTASASMLLYAVLLLLLYQILGAVILPLMLLPVLTITWLYGLVGILVIVPLILGFHGLLFTLSPNFQSLLEPLSIFTHVMALTMAVIIGESSHLRARFLDAVSQRKLKSKSIKQQKIVYETLFQSAGDAVFTLAIEKDSLPIFKDCNDASLKFFRCDSKLDILGKSPMDFSPEYQPSGKKSANLIEELAYKAMIGEPQVFEWLHELSDGSLQWGEVNLCLIDFEGEYFLQAIVRNIQSRKKAESQLRENERRVRQTQKMEAIGILTGGIAHEFNNLLVPILGYSELLLRKDISDDDKKMIENIHKSANRAKRLVRQMLAYGRHSMSQYDIVDLVELTEQAISQIAKTMPGNVVLEKQLQPVPAIRAMPNELHQVINNLCINAIHSMPDGGVLRIALGHVGARSFVQATGDTLNGDFIELTISDDGKGISEDIKPYIFDPFFTTREIGKGAGLGLSVVQGVIDQHHGHIDYRSDQGEGTTFLIYLPTGNPNPSTN